MSKVSFGAGLSRASDFFLSPATPVECWRTSGKVADGCAVRYQNDIAAVACNLSITFAGNFQNWETNTVFLLEITGLENCQLDLQKKELPLLWWVEIARVLVSVK